MNRFCAIALLLLLARATATGETNSASQTSLSSEQVRTACVQGRRHICGRVLQITSDGLVVESGYSHLLDPPFNQSWLVRGDAALTSDPSLVEAKEPDAIVVGLVFLTNVPKRPEVKLYDYVGIRGYPSGEQITRPSRASKKAASLLGQPGPRGENQSGHPSIVRRNRVSW